MTVKRVLLPKRSHRVLFTDRHLMRRGHPTRRLKALPPAPGLPIDWAKSLTFPMDGNDQYGDCMYAAGCHGDNTFTGNNGTESTFDQATIIKDYLAVAGGDNGMDEGMLISAWKAGLANTPAATIADAKDIDPTDAAQLTSAIYFFGGVLFMLDVPDAWVQSFDTGCVWDVPATVDQNNGHGVWINGVDAQGRYRVQTWGTYCWLTPAGLKACDPSAFVVFSSRWFSAQGVAPNGQTLTQLQSLWTGQPGPTPTPGPVGAVSLQQAIQWADKGIRSLKQRALTKQQAMAGATRGLTANWPA